MGMLLTTIKTSLERKLEAEAAALEAKIAARDPEFRQLLILRKAVTEMARMRQIVPRGRQLTLLGRPDEKPEAKPARQATSIGDAAFYALEDAGEPMSLADLLAALPRYGKEPGGVKPSWNLSNTLSADKKRFQSVDWKESKRWWLTGKPLPSV